jgi:hypothetical protein
MNFRRLFRFIYPKIEPAFCYQNNVSGISIEQTAKLKYKLELPFIESEIFEFGSIALVLEENLSTFIAMKSLMVKVLATGIIIEIFS